MYVVTMTHSFDPEAKAVLFTDYYEAVAYLHWWWGDYYNAEIAESSIPLNKDLCFHEEDYAVVTWIDGDQTIFTLADECDKDKRFEEIDWERYV